MFLLFVCEKKQRICDYYRESLSLLDIKLVCIKWCIHVYRYVERGTEKGRFYITKRIFFPFF